MSVMHRCLAQDAAVPVTATKLLPKLQVIEGVEVRRGNQTTIYQRVAPPVLPARPIAPTRSVIEEPLSAEEVARQERLAHKKFATIFLTATVYDHRLTEVRWQAGPQECRAFSNVDFHHLLALDEIETADTVFILLLGVNDQAFSDSKPEAEVAALREVLRTLPPRESFAPPRSVFVLAEAAVPATAAAAEMKAEVTALLDALHTYYDAHREALVEQSAKLAAERATRAEAERVHAAEPKHTVINFWPLKSRTYPTTPK